MFPPTLIFRHQRENLKKCTLSGLETREDFVFISYPKELLSSHFSLENYFLLSFDGPPLKLEDQHKGMIILDGTWKYAQKMIQNLNLPLSISLRSLPLELTTAYPRRQQDCPQPNRGLASIEAIYSAYFLLRRNCDDLLKNYYWKMQFVEKNKDLLIKNLCKN